MKLLTKASYSGEMNDRERENLALAYEAACESMVLLKNDGALPLPDKTVALYGAGASMTIKGGTGSGEVNERHSVTVLEGMEDRGFAITTRDWITAYEDARAKEEAAYLEEKRKINIFKLSNIMQMMFGSFTPTTHIPITEKTDADSCVYVISRQAGEGGDRRLERGDFLLTEGELQNIRFCAEHYDRFVLVINCGSPVDMAEIEQIPGINAIVYLSQLGTEGGSAFADLLTGSISPSGRLADTWAKSYDQIPCGSDYSYLNGDTSVEHYREGIFVGYRYFDTFGVEPAYPFGYGLSYTDFRMDSAGFALDGSRVTLKTTVTNTGSHPGKEVAQLYLSAPKGTMQKEYQALAAFGKTQVLEPGQRQELELTFDLKELASYREKDAAYVLEAGDYLLRLGRHSRDTAVVGVITVEGERIVSTHCNVCTLQEPMEELTAPERQQEAILPGIPKLYLAPDAIETVHYGYPDPDYDPDDRVKAFVDTLTTDEMAEILVGIGMFGGDTRFNLPGSVGNTTSKFWDRGLANVTLCDGPAGLRIQKRSTVTAKGKVKPVELAMSIFEAFPGFVKNLMLGDPEKEPVLYQYTTAFPVTAALAQTWNEDLLHRVGQGIHREMAEYGCTYWLAPAVNIHRNPLCGRNFEYYSEDPRLAGLLAASLTRGVQQEDGFYVTVKHFACNNCEDNRNKSDSRLSERTLREIYLRAFELTVRQGGAKGIMTSYNKINGVYAPNSYDLCTRVLRQEWGFDGVVMTDWFSTNPGLADTAGCITAGNDLIMPGGESFRKAIRKAVKVGVLDREDLRRSCARVVRSIFDSNIQKEFLD